MREKNIKRLIRAGVKVNEFNTEQVNQMIMSMSVGIDPTKYFANPKCSAETMLDITLSLLTEKKIETVEPKNEIIKTTQGYVEQVFDAESGELLSSRFTAEGDCYYVDSRYEVIKSDLYAPFNF